jgi:NADPH-dependent methylglyoxal reductase
MEKVKQIFKMGSTSKKDELILITGISGFVGAWITHTFLEAGYSVRGTVRSEKSIAGIKQVHAKHAERLSFAIVPDMAALDALDDAAKGVTGVVHTANPFIMNPKDNEEELLKPSITGVLNALRAAAKQGRSLRRVVLLASFASNLDLSKGTRPGFTYDDTTWNPATYEEAKASDSGAFSYCAAKALAEKAAWDWIETNQPSFSFVALDPPWIFGRKFWSSCSLTDYCYSWVKDIKD